MFCFCYLYAECHPMWHDPSSMIPARELLMLPSWPPVLVVTQKCLRLFFLNKHFKFGIFFFYCWITLFCHSIFILLFSFPSIFSYSSLLVLFLLFHFFSIYFILLISPVNWLYFSSFVHDEKKEKTHYTWKFSLLFSVLFLLFCLVSMPQTTWIKKHEEKKFEKNINKQKMNSIGEWHWWQRKYRFYNWYLYAANETFLVNEIE